MEVRVVDRRSLDEAEWDRLARFGSFFHTTTWADVCAEGLAAGRRGAALKARFLCGYEGDRLIAGMPGIVTRRFGLSSFDSMPNDTYGGPLFDDKLPDAERRVFLDAVADYFRSRRYSRVSITDFAGALSGWDGLNAERFRSFTHVIAGDSLDDYKPSDGLMRDIGDAEKAESRVIQIRTSQNVEAFYRLYRMTETRHGSRRPRYRPGFFQALSRIMADTDQLYWTGVIVNGKMIGSHINFLHGGMLINWQAASDYEKRRYRPNQLLLYDAIRYARLRDIRIINMGASPPEGRGLIRYKERWGADRIEYDVLLRRSWFRKLMGR